MGYRRKTVLTMLLAGLGLWYTGFMPSRDILFLTLAVAILVATGFWVWLLYYLIQIIRSVHGMVDDFRDRLRTIDEILQTIKDKLTSTHVQLTFLVEGLKKLLTFINNRRAKRRTSARASTVGDDF